MKSMDLYTALQILDEKGSIDDPITYNGEDMTPLHLEGPLSSTTKADTIRIGYYAKRGDDLVWVKNGTLSGMVKDRGTIR